MSASPSSAQADSVPDWVKLVTKVQRYHDLKWSSRVESPIGHPNDASSVHVRERARTGSQPSNRRSGTITTRHAPQDRIQLVDKYFQTAHELMSRLKEPTLAADFCRKVIQSVEQSFLLLFTEDDGRDADDLESNVFTLECMAEGFRKELDDLDPTQPGGTRLEIAPADHINLGQMHREEARRLATQLLADIRLSVGVPLSSRTDAQSWLAAGSTDPTPPTVIHQMEQDDEGPAAMGKARRQSGTLQDALNLAPREDI